MMNLIEDMNKFASKYIDTHVYSKEQWTKKEKEMLFGEAVLIAEGELYRLLNGYGTGQHGVKTWKKLNKIAAKYGCYVEQGFHWSWHFVKKDFIPQTTNDNTVIV